MNGACQLDQPRRASRTLGRQIRQFCAVKLLVAKNAGLQQNGGSARGY